MDQKRIEKLVREFLEAIGEDPKRNGLVGTPRRVAKMCKEIFAGLKKNPRRALSVIHAERHDEMVLLKDIPFYSICEHHLLPVLGKVHIAYIPAGDRVTGFSKLARVVDVISKRPQLQERMTKQIADNIMEVLKPAGVGVIIEARHLCLEMRGIKKPEAMAITSAVRGIFRKDVRTREEFLKLVKEK